MSFIDILIVVSVLLGIFIIVYSKMKNKDLRETWDDFKDLVNPVMIKHG